MLQLRNIKKEYRMGGLVQKALDDVSVSFRDSEFVAVLGPSGSGKTTLLNIIGGLDRADQGEMTINTVSTAKYLDRDWDAYRNHSIGFVFQSYNLIPHQTVLANVELALTRSNVSKGERHKKAMEVLRRVGLEEHAGKKPGQLSGGQMQRVAIARALINDPVILLADEPTGALDSDTSIQIMELIKEVAGEMLVIMVTHNNELAEQYASRIVRLRDGRIVSDTDPFDPEGAVRADAANEITAGEAASPKAPAVKNTSPKSGKVGMGFGTALSLSFRNLMTKKGRTFLTALACSIGITGIALILSLSSGVNRYIDRLQRDTMSSYPLTITRSTMDLSGMMSLHEEAVAAEKETEGLQEDLPDGISADYSMLEVVSEVAGTFTQNNLSDFKRYLDDPESEIHQYLGEGGIVYSYDVSFNAYSFDAGGDLVRTDADPYDLGGDKDAGSSGMMRRMRGGSSSSGGDFFSGLSSIMGGGAYVAANFSELTPGSGGKGISSVIQDSYELAAGRWPEAYDEVVIVTDRKNKLSATQLYQLGLITSDEMAEIQKIIVRGEEPERIVLSYEDIMNHSFRMIPACDMYVPAKDGTYRRVEEGSDELEKIASSALELKVTGIIRPAEEGNGTSLSTCVAYTAALTDHIIGYTAESPVIKAQEASPDINILTGEPFGTDAIASLMDNISRAYGIPLGSNATLEDNLSAFGKVSVDDPSSINIYSDSFESKTAISKCIDSYNDAVGEDDKITYTDYVALLTGSISKVINVISIVLIAFVAVSLIVSAIMIGIVTYISVLERTKEIGILRALGASRRNVSQVFNAETFITGFLAGLIGVLAAVLITIPVNRILAYVMGPGTARAVLPLKAGLVLILISIIVTVMGGRWPAKSAARKDPVQALRSE